MLHSLLNFLGTAASARQQLAGRESRRLRKARLLIVSYWFPPAGGIPVQRALSLARYLPECGIEVHVLAPKNPPAPQYDTALLALIPPEVTVHRAFTQIGRAHV